MDWNTITGAVLTAATLVAVIYAGVVFKPRRRARRDRDLEED
jgi:hypothetical protein